jgi:hypothetical protein
MRINIFTFFFFVEVGGEEAFYRNKEQHFALSLDATYVSVPKLIFIIQKNCTEYKMI